MRKLFLLGLIFFNIKTSYSQRIFSGNYDAGLLLAYDSISNKVTGYYENYSGFGSENSSPKFSCLFYIEGVVSGSQFEVLTYCPNDKTDSIMGELQIINNTTLSLKLKEDHGGCWNVQHFSEEKVMFSLVKQNPWIQVRYVTSDKTYFYADKSTSKKSKTYIIKNDFVCIDRIEGDWVHATFVGKKTRKGWIKSSDLNKF